MIAERRSMHGMDFASLIGIGHDAFGWASTGMGFPLDAGRMELQQRALLLLADDERMHAIGIFLTDLQDRFGHYDRSDVVDWIWENT